MIKIDLIALGPIAFFLLFGLDPIFYYLSSVSGLYIPIGSIGLLLAALLSISLITTKTPFSVKTYTILLVGTLTLVVVLVYHAEYGKLLDIYFWFRAFLFFCAGYYLAAFLDSSQRSMRTRVLFLYACVSIFVLTFYSLGEFNYLRIADGVAITTIILLAMCKEKFALLVSVVTAFLLYLIDSRAALIMFIGVVLMHFSSSRNRLLMFPVLTGAIGLAYLYLRHMYLNVQNIHNHRLVRLIFERDVDTSLSVRHELTANAVEVMTQYPLLGKYAYYRVHGIEGGYAHNGMSFVAELGLVGGFLLALLLVPQVLLLIRFLFSKAKTQSVCLKATAMVALFSIIGIVFAKGYVWSIFYYSAGMSVFVLMKGSDITRRCGGHGRAKRSCSF